MIRNATLIIDYAGKKFLLDPFLADKETLPPYGPQTGGPDAVRQDQMNPIFDLPLTVEEIVADIDAIIVTHLHTDHWDEAPHEALPRDIKLFTQNEEDAAIIRATGFTNVAVLQKDSSFEGIQLSKTKGEHGRGEILEVTGKVCGVVFKHESEKTLYIAGDTVWYDAIQTEIETHKPDVIVVNAGANAFIPSGPIIMDKEDVYEVYKAAPEATIMAAHMEAVNHWTLSRADLKEFAAEKGISNLLVPEDGEAYTF